ncbi:MAG: sensor histidine kinase [Rhodothalassiaceae bacterium]
MSRGDVTIPADALRQAQFAHLLRFVPLMTSVSAFNALLVLFLLGGTSPTPAMIAWALAIALPNLWSLLQWLRRRRHPAGTPRHVSARTMRHAFLWNAAMGALWGATGFVFFDHIDVVGRVLVVFVIGGMLAGLVSTLYVLPLNVVVYGGLSVLPVSLLLLLQETTLQRGMGVLLLVFAVALSFSVRVAYRHFREALAVGLALGEARDLLHDAIARSGEAFAILDADGQIVVANDLFREMCPDGQLPEGTGDGSHVMQLADGRWVKGGTSPIRGGGRVAVFADITGLKEKEAQLVEARHAAESASRAKSQFLAVMSHELRTPLNSIIGFAELLGDPETATPDDKIREYANYILKSGCHLLGLITDILDLTRIDTGQRLLEEQPVDLATFAEEVVAQMRPEAESAELTLSIDVAMPAIVCADPRSLRQILFNLLGNAIKFTRAGGTIRIVCDVDGDCGTLAVEDSGIGIAPEHAESVFEPFQQVDSGFAREGSGVGLGLALVRRLAEIQGGSVTLESTPGKGSRFTVRLPLAPRHQEDDSLARA